jgi:hypothetical protein
MIAEIMHSKRCCEGHNPACNQDPAIPVTMPQCAMKSEAWPEVGPEADVFHTTFQRGRS